MLNTRRHLIRVIVQVISENTLQRESKHLCCMRFQFYKFFLLNQSTKRLGVWNKYVKIDWHEPMKCSIPELWRAGSPNAQKRPKHHPRPLENLRFRKNLGQSGPRWAKLRICCLGVPLLYPKYPHPFCGRIPFGRNEFQGNFRNPRVATHTPHISPCSMCSFPYWSHIDFSHWRTYLLMG